jgi:UDP-N-acetylglucosamine 1-carboxyvinyltransferase
MIALLEKSKVLGEIKVSGSKNAFFPAVGAGIALGAEKIVIKNTPKIKDVFVMLELLKELGCEYKIQSSEVIINAEKIKLNDVSPENFGKIRGSVVIFGALLGRFGNAKIPMPGGCKIGKRPIDQHIKAANSLGYKVEEKEEYVKAYGTPKKEGKIKFDIKTVTGTENAILMSINSKVEIENVAIEPEVQELINYLKKYGVDIRLETKEDKILIDGTKREKIKEAEFELIPDRIEAGTWLILAAATEGKLKIKNVIAEHIKAVIDVLKECGTKIKISENEIEVEGIKKYKPVDLLIADSYPAFPTDLQPQMSVMLLKAEGKSRIKDNIFPERVSHIWELKKMGADISLENGEIIINPSKIYGAEIEAKDLRGAAALVIAGLIAEKNQTILKNFELIERGYENFVKKLKNVNAKIEVFEDEIIKEEIIKGISNYVPYST